MRLVLPHLDERKAHRDGVRVPTIVTFSVGVSSQDTSAGPERELRTVLNLISHLTCKADDPLPRRAGVPTALPAHRQLNQYERLRIVPVR